MFHQISNGEKERNYSKQSNIQVLQELINYKGL